MPPQQTQQEAALFKAAQAGKLDEVLRIAEELGGDIKTFADANGANCLHVAAHAGQTALCRQLVDDLQFDINSQDGGGAQCFDCASGTDQRLPPAMHGGGGDGDCCRQPIDRRLDLCTFCWSQAMALERNSSRQLLLGCCSRLPLTAACGGHIPAGTGSTPLLLAVANERWDTAQALLAAGADPNRRSSSPADAPGPLHLAVAAGQLELASALLAAGADPSARSSSGSPLELAAARSNAPMVAALLAAGADACASARQGLTPLFMVSAWHGACSPLTHASLPRGVPPAVRRMCHSAACLQWLRERVAGARCSQPLPACAAGLQAVAVGSSAEVVRQLVGAGADVNGRALGAFTPLHVAAEGGKLELVEELLQVGHAALRLLRAPGCRQGGAMCGLAFSMQRL